MNGKQQQYLFAEKWLSGSTFAFDVKCAAKNCHALLQYTFPEVMEQEWEECVSLFDSTADLVLAT